MADYFHGRDGLGGIYNTHPHLSPADTWKSLFKLDKSANADEREMAEELSTSHETLFTPSQLPAHEEILRLLRENEPDTFTIVAVGPLTNLALAAAIDPETFLRVKEVVVMGGAINVAGNVSYGSAPALHPRDFPYPPFKLIKQYPSPLRAVLNIRNQITPVAGVPAQSTNPVQQTDVIRIQYLRRLHSYSPRIRSDFPVSPHNYATTASPA